MNDAFRRLFDSVKHILLKIHFAGAAIAFAVFSYEYVVKHGFPWFLLGGPDILAILLGIIDLIGATVLKSLIWEVFLLLFLIQLSS